MLTMTQHPAFSPDSQAGSVHGLDPLLDCFQVKGQWLSPTYLSSLLRKTPAYGWARRTFLLSSSTNFLFLTWQDSEPPGELQSRGGGGGSPLTTPPTALGTGEPLGKRVAQIRDAQLGNTVGGRLKWEGRAEGTPGPSPSCWKPTPTNSSPRLGRGPERPISGEAPAWQFTSLRTLVVGAGEIVQR